MAGSKAFQVMSRRAVSCSFSSVFHLRSAGYKQAKEVEDIFKRYVLLPMAGFGSVVVSPPQANVTRCWLGEPSLTDATLSFPLQGCAVAYSKFARQ
mmetsp:Transcript_43485/g.136391  ORF Transcript_43485/g.136391 Transcript_43485/m.136391 type:complete len:96 (-) Transcript_43485:1664-1951(-)